MSYINENELDVTRTTSLAPMPKAQTLSAAQIRQIQLDPTTWAKKKDPKKQIVKSHIP